MFILRDDLAAIAFDLTLPAADLASLAVAAPPGAVAGGRSPDAHLAHLDSEKRRAHG